MGLTPQKRMVIKLVTHQHTLHHDALIAMFPITARQALPRLLRLRATALELLEALLGLGILMSC